MEGESNSGAISSYNGKDERIKVICELVHGRSVLDVGCVQHNAYQGSSEKWLHKHICGDASYVLGVDLEKEEVAKLSDRYNMIHGDAQTIQLDQKFEAVVAGEIIEHLENPGLFLSNMKKHLLPGGFIIVSTPNPFYPKRIFDILLKERVRIHPQHVSWYCDFTLEQLLRRSGYTNVETKFVSGSERFGGVSNLLKTIRARFCTHFVSIGYLQSD